jgi:hypothetical protein
MAMSRKMETEKPQNDVLRLEATLDELLLGLRRLNTRGGQKSEAVLRFNQQTRILLEQIHSSLTNV